MILDAARDRGMVIELKHAEDASQIETALNEATAQIKDKKYDSMLKCYEYKTINKYVTVCSGKYAVVM